MDENCLLVMMFSLYGCDVIFFKGGGRGGGILVMF